MKFCYKHKILQGYDNLISPLGKTTREQAIASLPIEKIVKKGQRICIITDDNTRHTPVKKILKELLPRLEKSGINKNQILIVMALGSHRKMTSEEIIEKVGKNVFDTYRVINSEFHDKSLMVEIGQSQIGTPIRVLKEIMEADIRIGIGSIAPHGCMGWSGAAADFFPYKTAMPSPGSPIG
jgi:nickel-dependent lactate racemase